MSDVLAPPARTALADADGNATRPYYVYFTALASNLKTLSASVNGVLAQIPVASPFSPSANVTGGFSIITRGTLKTGIVSVLLEGDVDQATALSFYGALTAGQKGWQNYSANFQKTGTTLDLADLADSGTGALVAITRDAKGRVSGTRAATITGTAGRVTVANGSAAAGLPTIDLATVLDAGGGALQKTAFDAYGRKTGASTATTSDLSEGANLYFTAPRVLATALTGLSTATAAAVVATDTALAGVGKLQAQATSNATAIAGKEPAIIAGTTAQFWRGDKSWQALNKAAVGLGSVDNTSDATKPVSAAQATADALSLPLDGSRHMTGELLNDNGRFTGGTSFAVLQTSNAAGGIIYLRPFANSATNQTFIDANGTYTIGGQMRIAGVAAPATDNTVNLGDISLRWKVVYAGTGSINTSDAREKTAVAALTASELSAASDLSRAIGTYQWLAQVAEKGADNARHHAGLTVQRAIKIMRAYGLDPMRYGFICYDQWGELPEVRSEWPACAAVLDDDGNVIEPAVEAGSEITQAYRPAGDRYSFRTDELLLFIARGIDARLTALEGVAP